MLLSSCNTVGVVVGSLDGLLVELSVVTESLTVDPASVNDVSNNCGELLFPPASITTVATFATVPVAVGRKRKISS